MYVLYCLQFFYRNRDGDPTPILSMFEIVLSTIENKLQRVENLDRAVHHLMRKMDMMERKLAGNNADIMTAIEALEKETHEARVSVKLNQLSARLDNLCSGIDRSNSDNLDDHVQDILVAQPSNRESRVLQQDPNHGGMLPEAGMEEVKEVINGIDRRLGVHINIVSENLSKVANMVEEVRDVLLDDTDPQIDTDGSNQGHDGPKQRSKFDKLLSSMHPLLVVRTVIKSL